MHEAVKFLSNFALDTIDISCAEPKVSFDGLPIFSWWPLHFYQACLQGKALIF